MGVSILDPIEWGHPFSQGDLVLALSSFRSIGGNLWEQEQGESLLGGSSWFLSPLSRVVLLPNGLNSL